jgi:RimJ/RimL family protein N-acetyltransferase
MAASMISVRPATVSDAEILFEWRTDLQTRAASVATGELLWQEHAAWLAAALADNRRYLYVAENDSIQPDARVGVCRFDLDLEMTVAEVSINTSPTVRGQGMSKSILEAAMARFQADLGQTPLTATIRPNNIASIRIFEACGFTRIDAPHTSSHAEFNPTYRGSKWCISRENSTHNPVDLNRR